MRSPWGDQKGRPLFDASLVNRVSVPRFRSRIHRSDPAPEGRTYTTDFSSGESAAYAAPGAPTGPRDLPVRSYQPSWLVPLPAPVEYSSTPLSDTVDGR